MRYILSILFSFCSLIFYCDLNAQVLFPEGKPVYIDTEVPRIDIYIQISDLQSLYLEGNESSNIEFKAVFKFTSSTLVDTLYDVGVRLRGNTSRYSQKKSMKVSFNTFIAGQKFQGLEKMNLNGEHNDPSIIRSKLGWDMLNSIGVPASRANHVRLYINNQYYGLYISVEHIDEEFVENRFGNKDGNLYKCLYPADLTFKGSNPSSYKYIADGHRVYELKTNIEADDYSDIANLITVINQTSLTDLPLKLEPIFNVNSFLKYLAVEALIGHWDGYSYNKNNFYLYKNTSTGKFEFIPYDVDNTFGIDWFNVDWATRNVTTWAKTNEERPLNKKILSVDIYKKRYLFYINQLLGNQFNPSILSNRANQLKSMITEYAYSDPYRPLDYGWSPTDFDNSYNQSLGNHVKYGLVPYINKRHQFANSQVSVANIPPVVANVYHKAISSKVPIKIAARVDDEETPRSVKLTYWTNSTPARKVDMSIDSTGFYTAKINPFSNSFTKFYYRITAVDIENQTTTEPLFGENTIDFSANSSIMLCVNEVMTSNTHIFPDEYGDYSDWVELYNYGNSAIWLGDITITDNLDKPNKWLLPDLTIQPGEFMLFWADGNITKGKNHLPFKLNREGEDVGVFRLKKYIDGFNISRISKDNSLGYFPNAKGLPTVLKSPTPGFSNIYTENGYRMILPELIVYPNPVTTVLNINLSFRPNSDYTISVYSIGGKLEAEQCVDFSNPNTTFSWNLSYLDITTGIYIVSVTLHEEMPIKLKPQRIIYIRK